MRIAGVSHMTLWNSALSSTSRIQADLTRLNQEVVTGRMADAGLELGAGAAEVARLHIDLAAFDNAQASNTLAAARLVQTDNALAQLAEDGQGFLEQLVSGRAGATDLVAIAESAMAGFVTVMNRSDGDNYLFGGINSDVAPMAAFDAGPQAAIEAAFATRFGMTPDDPAVATIAAADMTDFLDNEFAALFDDPAWGATWSSADDKALRTHISPTEVIDTSVSANEQATRKLAMVYSMVAALGTDGLSEETRGALLDKAITVVSEATAGVTALRTEVGVAQNRIEDASDRLDIQKDILTRRVDDLEGVDTAETKVKIDLLTTQMEMSYALTSRLLGLSLVNYA